MKKILLTLLVNMLCYWAAYTQNDTTIYQVTEKRPSFPGCDWAWFSEQQKDSCRQYAMADFLKSMLRYPNIARDSNISGRVVVQFVVEQNGALTHLKLLKDIGGGCGEEALRIVKLMNDLGIRWIPGQMNGKAVRSYFSLPVNFKLQEDPGYTIVDGYPVYYLLDSPLKYKDGDEALSAFLQKHLQTPKELNDSCKAGVIQAEVLVAPNGMIKALQLDDFSALGFDAQFEAIQAVSKTMGQWEYATYKGKAVPTSYNVRLIFKPTAAKCKAENELFEKAYSKINEAIAHSDKKEYEPSIAKLSEAIRIFPSNMEPHYLRGLIFMNQKKNNEACEDLSKVKNKMNVNWLDNILPLICR
jgi:tetratricopeptide (TPR) repeat protein